MACNIAHRTKEERMQEMEKVWAHWSNKGNIKQRFSYDGKHIEDASAENMKWFIEQRLQKPFDSDSPLTDGDYRRIMVEIDSFDRALGGNFSNLAFVVPEGISKQDPTSRRFYQSLNKILDYERVQINSVMTDNAYIADHMMEAYIYQHKKSGIMSKIRGDEALKKLRDIRKELAESDPDTNLHTTLVQRLEEFVNSDKEGITIKEFIELVNMSKERFQAASTSAYRDKKGNPYSFNPHVYQAVKVAKKNLKTMGQTYINSLTGLQKMVALKYTGSTDIKAAKGKDAKALHFIEIIEDSKQNIEQGMKDGGYFPQVQFETMMTIKERLNKALTANVDGQDLAYGDMIDGLLGKVNIGDMPAHTKRRSQIQTNKYWEKDPLMVLKEYGDQASQFNKMIYTQITYLEALRDLPNTGTEFQRGLRRFIDEEYAVFTRGTTGRPDWANKAVTGLNAFQTARTMGLNFTGALKNAASAIHFYSRVGLSALNNTREAMNDGSFKEMMLDVEKETGFLFTDAAPELYTEGLITRKDMESGKVEFNALTGKITMDNAPIKDILVKSGKWTLEKALFFHRLTENHQRKWMFRTAMHKMYSELTSQGYPPDKAKRFSMDYALNMVNGFAYEYAAHAKSKMVRGEGRTIEEMESGSIVQTRKGVTGAFSEVAFHLLHYPLSLAETHYSALKGAHKALLAKQGFESEEIQYAARYAAVAAGVALVSVLANANLFNIFENETQDRIMRIKDDILLHSDKDKGTFGLLSEFTGPTLGQLKYSMIAAGIIDIDGSTLNKILFGNVDFGDETDEMANRYAAYQWSTFWGTTKNKAIPALQNGRGRDLIMHYMKLYPSTWTKAANEKIYGRKPKKSTKKITNISAALAALERL